MKRSALCIVLCLLLALLPTASLAEGDASYVFDAFDGTALELTPYEGKAIYISYFTSWCGYCMQEMPYIAQAFRDYSPDELQIILVHAWSGEDDSVTADVVSRYGLEGILILEDQDMALSAIVGLQGFPTNILIDKQGYLYQYTYALGEGELAGYLDALGVSPV